MGDGEKYRVKLSAEEREELKAMVSKGRSGELFLTARPLGVSRKLGTKNRLERWSLRWSHFSDFAVCCG